MRIGITVHFQFSIFSGGGASAIIAMAEAMRLLSHEVTLINVNGTTAWWEDLLSLKKNFSCVNLDDVKEPFDLVLETANTLNGPDVRKRVGKQCIWIVRRPIILNDIEHSIFPISLAKRDLEGLSAIWIFDQEATGDDIQYLETLARVPVRTVPYVWSPSIIETYRRETGIPSWLQVTIQLTQQAGKNLPWSPHICETNSSATSSCTIPMVILRELKKQGEFFFNKYKIHNAQTLEKSDYFKQNVMNHCRIEDLSGEFLGRQRITDWIMDPMSCIVGHLRFRRLRPYMLDALWLGIPFVHNSEVLKNLGCGYEGYFYEDNSITGGVRALTQIQRDLTSAKGMFMPGAMPALQQKILSVFSPMSGTVQDGWRAAIASLSSLPAPVPFPTAAVPAPVPAAAPAPVAVVAPLPVPVSVNTTDIAVLFTDMWDDFNPDYNMFLLLLQEGSVNITPKPKISGYSIKTLPATVKPNLHIFGPFGSEWQDAKWSKIPKVHFTGENTKPLVNPDVVLNLGFQHADFVDERYIRLPLWMLEIDWFGCDVARIKNPKPLPLDSCVSVQPLTDRSGFCAFVVTNPCNPVRNDAFHWLNRYKHVDSAGRLFNNIGDEIFAGLGGGGGELKKHEFLKRYKFCLAYENSSSQGYTTEKLLHAKAAGCIPIYWGDPKVERDFSTSGFIDARNIKTPEELIEAVAAVDRDPELYKKIYSVPALDEYKRDIVRRTLSQVSFSMLKAAMPSANIEQLQVPRFLGATTSAEAATMREKREGTVVATVSKQMRDDPIIVSYATARFLPSLHHFMSGLSAQKKVITGLEARIWLGNDVDASVEKTFTTNFPFATFSRLPTSEVPEGFPDYWSPEHFAWKLWIYNQLATDTTIHGRLVFYLDSGIFMCRWPKAWLQIVQEKGICVLEDPREENRRWCQESFCLALGVTEDEKNKQQTLAGCIPFIAGSYQATSLFTEAYKLSKIRSVIAGPKWAGIKDGKPYGHRHDQSILSILSHRLAIARYPLDEVYCDHSLRKTFLSGKALYVHRGGFQLHKPFAPQIDDCFTINLDRRADRMEKLYSNNPELKGRTTRFSAVEGRTIKLTPALARLFKPHDFFWKKAIMGCALSHLSLWFQLVMERPEISNYLILEDDVKLNPDWERKWNEASGYIPDDYDVIYLGGILPPNRAGFERTKERVNDYFSQVAPNKFFGQQEPNRYFHWCAYSYVLSRSGANKILEILAAHDGYWTSADHMICNPVQHMNLYFLDPLVAGCYQDDDPKYATSNFNDFSRIDGFDSDLWNNDERFSAAEVESMLRKAHEMNIGVNVPLALQDLKATTTQVTKEKEKEKEKEEVIGKETESTSINEQSLLQTEALSFVAAWSTELWGSMESVQKLQMFAKHLRRSAMPTCDPPITFVRSVYQGWLTMKSDLPIWSEVESKLKSWSGCEDLNKPLPEGQKRRICVLKDHRFDLKGMYERRFFEELFGPSEPIIVDHITMNDPAPVDMPIVIVQRPHIALYEALFQKWSSQGSKFYVLHLSDEHCTDSLEFYRLPGCLGVVRNYLRPIPAEAKDKVTFVPLGYHWTTPGASDDPLNKTPRLPFRNTLWSFYGTGWASRSTLLSPLMDIGPKNLHLLDSWDSPEKVGEQQYITGLLDTFFVPCPAGNNVETYRLYEALECGCVPIYVKDQEKDDNAYIGWLQKEIGLLPVRTWDEARALIVHFMNDKSTLEGYRNTLLSRWSVWKMSLGQQVRKTLSI